MMSHTCVLVMKNDPRKSTALIPAVAVILRDRFNASLIMTAGIEEVGAVAVIAIDGGDSNTLLLPTVLLSVK